MKLIGRMLPAVWRGLSQPTLPPTAALTRQYRVLPHDLDINLHLNNGRYLQLMDVCRVEWLLRTGTLQAARRKGWRPLLGGATVRFRRECRLFDRIAISTRVACWDDRWFYLEHAVCAANGQPAAFGLVRAMFRVPGCLVPPEEVIAAIGYRLASPPMPDHVTAWIESDRCLGEALVWRPGLTAGEPAGALAGQFAHCR